MLSLTPIDWVALLLNKTRPTKQATCANWPNSWRVFETTRRVYFLTITCPKKVDLGGCKEREVMCKTQPLDVNKIQQKNHKSSFVYKKFSLFGILETFGLEASVKFYVWYFSFFYE